MTSPHQNAKAVGQNPERPSDKEFRRLAGIFDALAAAYSSYGAIVESFANDPATQAHVATHHTWASAVREDPTGTWLELTEFYRVEGERADLRPPTKALARPQLADILARETGWDDESVAAMVAVEKRSGSLGLSICNVNRPPDWQAETCQRLCDALADIVAAKRAFAGWIIRNIGHSNRTGELTSALNGVHNEIAKLKKWKAVFSQQTVEHQRPH